MEKQRVIFLDYLRFFACLMVLVVHCCEPFYLGGPGTYVASLGDALWMGAFDSACRAAVPLFVLASSYLLFPVQGSTRKFFLRRIERVLIPLGVWMVLYACFSLTALSPIFGGVAEPTDVVANFKQLIFNFVPHAGHLWFVYMLLGVYMLMPLLSPWVEKVGKRGEEALLVVWLFTTTAPFLTRIAQNWVGNGDLWGYCPWNDFGALQYVSGFIGYVVLGHYLRTYVEELSWKKTLAWAVPLWLVGYAITFGCLWLLLPTSGAGYPLAEPYQFAVDMEMSWGFCSTGVVLTTVAYFLVIRKFCSTGWLYRHIVLPVSKRSYGIYLMHMFVLTPVVVWLRSLGLPTVGVICLGALLTYSICGAITWVLSFIPKSKYIIG